VSLLALGIAVLLGQARPQVLADLEAIEQQMTAFSGQVDDLRARAATVAAERDTARAALSAAEASLAARRAGTSTRLRTFYRLKRRGMARLLFEAESPTDLRRRVHYLLELIRADETLARAFSEGLAAKRAAAAKLDADQAALAGVEADVEARIAALESERARRVALVRDVQSRPELAAHVMRERDDAAIALEASMRTVEATSPSSPGDAAGFRAAKGQLAPPVRGSVVRPFGPYADPNTGADANNLGIDYAAPLGTPFRAVFDGVVTRSGWLRGYGQIVMLQHGPYTTLYAHANGLRVAQGQSVKKGDVLGLVGTTGLVEDADARLHFELRYNNTPQDPGAWLSSL
jgi:murein DD-endopeptidase MepM/ murein hydrolase activator NlpD